MLRPRLFALFLVLCAASVAHGQTPTATLYGTVVSDSTGEPLAGAHVFIAVSKMGTVTDERGRYTLEDVPLGAHRLYATTLGYSPSARDVMLRKTGRIEMDFRLAPTVIEIDAVTVEAKGSKRWKERLEKFTRLFIGESANADDVKIVNAEVMDFEDNLGRFVARAAQPLIIENRALGYRIQYFLKEFGSTSGRTWYDGEPLYEEMTPESPEQEALWAANREKAFMGSFRHFALALLADRLDEQGFLIYSHPAYAVSDAGAKGEGVATTIPGFTGGRFPVKATDIYKPGANPNEKLLDFQGAVEIIYRGEMEEKGYRKWLRGYMDDSGWSARKERYQTSWIQLETGPTIMDYKGDVLDPYGVTYIGYLAYERIADELPKEYRPPGSR